MAKERTTKKSVAERSEKIKSLPSDNKKKNPIAKNLRGTASDLTKYPDGKHLSEQVNMLIDKLIELQRQQIVDFAFRVGELVVQELFQGNAKLLHQPGPKANALSRLANHPRLPFSPATLSRSVGVYELLQRLPQFRNNKAVALGHLYAVLAVPTKKQEKLLSTAIEKSWDVAQLLKEVAKLREKGLGGKKGRPRLPAGIKALGAVGRMFKGKTPLHDLSFVEELDKDQVEQMKKVVDEMRAWCSQAAPLLERRLKVVEAPTE